MIESPWYSGPLPAPTDMYSGLLAAVLVGTLTVHTFGTLTGPRCFALLAAKGPAYRQALNHIMFLVPVNVIIAALTLPWVWKRPTDAWMRLPMTDTHDLYEALNWLVGLLLWASLAATTLGLLAVTIVAVLRPVKDHVPAEIEYPEPAELGTGIPERYGMDLSNEEYLALQGFLYSGGGQGWSLLAGSSSVMGWHWKDPSDAVWGTANTALEGFFPEQSSREAAVNCGWRVVPDHTNSGRLREFLDAELLRENAKQIKHTTVDLDDLPTDAPLTPEEAEQFSQLYPDHNYELDRLQHT